MTIIFPPTCTTEASRMAWCYRALRKLNKLHEGVGVWFRDGISVAEYDQFPQKIKTKYSYVEKLSEVNWKDFSINVSEKITFAIGAEILKARSEAAVSTYWNPDLDSDIN